MIAPEVVDCGEMTIGSPFCGLEAARIYIAAKPDAKPNSQWAYLFVDKEDNTIASKHDIVRGNTRIAELTAAIEALKLARDYNERVFLMSSSPTLLRVLDGKCTGGRYKELYDKFYEAARQPNILVSCLQGKHDDELCTRCESLLADTRGGDSDA